MSVNPTNSYIFPGSDSNSEPLIEITLQLFASQLHRDKHSVMWVVDLVTLLTPWPMD
jgi:hypothetical protein